MNMKKLWIIFLFNINALSFIHNALADVMVTNYNCPYSVPITLQCADEDFLECTNWPPGPSGGGISAGQSWNFPNGCAKCTISGMDFPATANNGAFIHLWQDSSGGDCQCYDCPNGSSGPTLKQGQGTPKSGQQLHKID